VATGNSDVSAWIPELWGMTVLSHLKAQLVAARLVNRDYDTPVANEGDTINVPLPPSLSAGDKTAGSAVVYTAVSAATTPVVLNKHKYVAFQVDDIAKMQARPDVLDNYGKSAAIALAEAIETATLDEYTNAAAAVGTPGTDLAKASLLSARKTLMDAKVPPSDSRFAIISTKDYENILSDLSTTTAGSMNADRSPLREGSAGRLYGFDIYESQLAPSVAGSPVTTHGIAGHRDAVVLVTRPLTAPPAGSGVISAVVSDPDVGITMRVMLGFNQTYMQQNVTYDVLFGTKTVRSSFMVDLES